MVFNQSINLIIFMVVVVMINNTSANNQLNLFNFTTTNDISNWSEESDTVRTVGMSKAALVLQKTHIFQRVILFTLLNPQKNGACFAGVRTKVLFDLSNYHSIKLNVRGQGFNMGYKVVLRHNGWDNEPYPTYENLFKLSNENFETVSLKLKDFKAYYRGKEVDNALPLNTANITSFGLQIYGGVYMPKKQHGVSSMEINWIAAQL